MMGYGEDDVPDPTPRQQILGWTIAIIIGLGLWALMMWGLWNLLIE